MVDGRGALEKINREAPRPPKNLLDSFETISLQPCGVLLRAACAADATYSAMTRLANRRCGSQYDGDEMGSSWEERRAGCSPSTVAVLHHRTLSWLAAGLHQTFCFDENNNDNERSTVARREERWRCRDMLFAYQLAANPVPPMARPRPPPLFRPLLLQGCMILYPGMRQSTVLKSRHLDVLKSRGGVQR